MLIWYEKKAKQKHKRWRIHKIQEKKFQSIFHLNYSLKSNFSYLRSSWVEVTTTTKCSSFKIANWYSWQHHDSHFMKNMPPKQLFHNMLEFQVALFQFSSEQYLAIIRKSMKNHTLIPLNSQQWTKNVNKATDIHTIFALGRQTDRLHLRIYWLHIIEELLHELDHSNDLRLLFKML